MANKNPEKLAQKIKKRTIVQGFDSDRPFKINDKINVQGQNITKECTNCTWMELYYGMLMDGTLQIVSKLCANCVQTVCYLLASCLE